MAQGVKGSQSPCSVGDCSKMATAHGWCQFHYQRNRRNGHPGPAYALATRTRNPWGTVNSQGYRQITVDSHSMLEHRQVMGSMLGRALLAHETVHHRNGNKLDNRPENLELWSTRQPKGQRVEDKVEYALEILRLYAPSALER